MKDKDNRFADDEQSWARYFTVAAPDDENQSDNDNQSDDTEDAPSGDGEPGEPVENEGTQG